MALARQTAISLTNLRLRVRRIVGDVDTTAANQRFSDANDIDPCINDMLVEMQNKLNGPQVGEALVSTTMTYTGSAETTDLPAAVNYESIFRVEDYTDTTRPIEITYVDPEEIERWPASQLADYPSLLGRTIYKYTILGGTGTTRTIALRPKPSGAKTLRISYVAAPIIYGAAADTLPLSPRWQELVARGAAERLGSIDSEQTDGQDRILARLWEQYLAFGQRVRGPMRITKVRRGR